MHSCTPDGLPCTWVDAGFSIFDGPAAFGLMAPLNNYLGSARRYIVNTLATGETWATTTPVGSPANTEQVTEWLNQEWGVIVTGAFPTTMI